MGLKFLMDIDTDRGNTFEMYLRIDNIQINSITKQIKVAVTLWESEEESIKANSGNSFIPLGQVGYRVIYYAIDSKDPLGKEINIPVLFNIPYPKDWKGIELFEYCYHFIKNNLTDLFDSSEIVNS